MRASSTPDGGDGNADDSPLVVHRQTLDDLSTVVTVAYADTDATSWVAIGTPADAPQQFLGWERLTLGTHTNLAVALARPIEDGEQLVAYLLYDLGEAGVLDGLETDLPYTRDDASPVFEAFAVDVVAGTPALRFTLALERASLSWRWTSVAPVRFADRIEPDIANPTITLTAGWRYALVDTVSATHPIELIKLHLDSTADEVLLAQTGDGVQELDPEIAWDERADGEVRFTLAGTLVDLLDGYRCTAHPAAMRGQIAVVAAVP